MPPSCPSRDAAPEHLRAPVGRDARSAVDLNHSSHPSGGQAIRGRGTENLFPKEIGPESLSLLSLSAKCSFIERSQLCVPKEASGRGKGDRLPELTCVQGRPASLVSFSITDTEAKRGHRGRRVGAPPAPYPRALGGFSGLTSGWFLLPSGSRSLGRLVAGRILQAGGRGGQERRGAGSRVKDWTVPNTVPTTNPSLPSSGLAKARAFSADSSASPFSSRR